MRWSASVGLAGLVLLALIASFVDGLGTARVILAIAALSVPPGAAVLAWVHPARCAASLALALSLALSPFVVGAFMTVLLLADFSAMASARLVLLAVLGALVADLYRRPRRADDDDEGLERDGPTSVGAPALLLAVAITAVIAAPIVESNRVRASIHGMLHASILYSAVDRGVPPENPFFAGRPVRYYWAYHVASAAAGEIGAVEPTTVFCASNLLTLTAFLLLLAHLANDAFRSRAAAALAVPLGFLGLNPFGAFFFRGRHPEVSLEEVAGGADPIHYIKELTIGGDERISATFTKFMNVSSFPVSFTLLLASWLLLARLVRRPELPLAGLAGLAIAGSIALSPITGATAGLALGAAALVLLLPSGWGGVRRGALLAAGALIAGLLLALPFVLVGSGAPDLPREQLLAVKPELAKLSRVLWNLGPILLLAVPAAIAAARRKDRGTTLLSISLLPLLVTAIVLSFPVASEYKLVRMAAPLLGVFAAGSLALLFARFSSVIAGAIAVVVTLLFVPTNALIWNAYRAHANATLPYHGDGTRVVVDFDAHPIAEMYEWIRTNTPADAVIIDNPRMKDRHFAGPLHGDEIAVLAHRPVLTDVPYYMTDYEPGFLHRFRIVDSIFGGERLQPEDYELLHSLRRPIYLLLRSYDRGVARAIMSIPQDGRWERVHQTDAGYLFRLRLGR